MSSRIFVMALVVFAIMTVSVLDQVSGIPVPQNEEEVAVGFSGIDISKTPGLGDAAKAAADSACDPAQLSAAELKARNRLAEDAEKSFFNVQIENAGNNEALADALDCQKIKNKVLKNTCQFQAAILENNQGQIDENTTQIAANIRDTDTKCANVDESLFVDPPA